MPEETPAKPTTSSTDIALLEDPTWNPDGFAHSQRVANMYAQSMLIPEHLRGKLADVGIALLMARRLREDPLVVMQAIVVISGKAGWSAQYMIARANRSTVFKGRIDWRVTLRPGRLTFKRTIKQWVNGKPNKVEVDASMPDYTITAYATLADTGKEVAIDVTSQMAIDEGWANNEKYSSIPELMLRYRSATFLIRLYAGDVMLGLPVDVEIDLEPEHVAVTQSAAPTGRAALGLPSPAVVDADVVPERQADPVAASTPVPVDDDEVL